MWEVGHSGAKPRGEAGKDTGSGWCLLPAMQVFGPVDEDIENNTLSNASSHPLTGTKESRVDELHH